VRAGAPLRARAAPDIELEAEESSVVALLGGSARKGSWEPPARLRVLAVMGGVELDFRDLYEGETFVDVLAIMGGVSIIVPPDIDVDADGQGFLGGFGSLTQRAEDAGAPLLRIGGTAVMGGVEIKVKKLPRRLRT
jgi:hypothetical protein